MNIFVRVKYSSVGIFSDFLSYDNQWHMTMEGF